MDYDITKFELLLMSVLWEKQEEMAVREILEEVEKRKHAKYVRTTISTYMGYLVKKGFVTSRKQGVLYYYKPTVEKETFLKYLNNKFINFWFGGNVYEALKFMVEENLIKKEDLEAIITLQ